MQGGCRAGTAAPKGPEMRLFAQTSLDGHGKNQESLKLSLRCYTEECRGRHVHASLISGTGESTERCVLQPHARQEAGIAMNGRPKARGGVCGGSLSPTGTNNMIPVTEHDPVTLPDSSPGHPIQHSEPHPLGLLGLSRRLAALFLLLCLRRSPPRAPP